MKNAEEISYRDDWLAVDGVPTKFLTWGTWVEDLRDEDVVLMITGNPGITEFYLQFLNELHKLLKIPIWAVSHAGKLCYQLMRYRTFEIILQVSFHFSFV